MPHLPKRKPPPWEHRLPTQEQAPMGRQPGFFESFRWNASRLKPCPDCGHHVSTKLTFARPVAVPCAEGSDGSCGGVSQLIAPSRRGVGFRSLSFGLLHFEHSFNIEAAATAPAASLRCNAPRFVAREAIHVDASARFILVIKVAEHLPRGVVNLK